MIRIWGRRTSFNVQKVLWLAAELGLDYEHVPAGGRFGRLDDADFRALNPHGKVPVLEEDGIVLWESQAILRYLAARYGRDRFWHEDPAVRASADAWMDWAATAWQPEFMNGVFRLFYRTARERHDWPAIRESMARCAEYLGLLDRLLADRPYLLGDALSLADIPAGGLLYRYYELEIERPDLPNLAAWYARLRARPAYAHVMIPFEELCAW